MKYQIQYREYVFGLENRKYLFGSKWRKWKNYKSEAGAIQAVRDLRKKSKQTMAAVEGFLPERLYLWRYRIIEAAPKYKIGFCEPCLQMTNHLNGVCQECK